MKILLNAFWGKYGEVENKFKYRLIADPNEWNILISNPQFIVQRA